MAVTVFNRCREGREGERGGTIFSLSFPADYSNLHAVRYNLMREFERANLSLDLCSSSVVSVLLPIDRAKLVLLNLLRSA